MTVNSLNIRRADITEDANCCACRI